MNDLPERISGKKAKEMDTGNGKMASRDRQHSSPPADQRANREGRTLDATLPQPLDSKGPLEKASGGTMMSVKEKPQKVKRFDTLLDLVRTLEPQAFYKRRLPYKNWTLLIFKRNDRFAIKIIARREKTVFTKLSMDFNDIRYVSQLLKDVKETFKKLGIEPEQI
ncbi:MAG: hypothetical protein QXZ58_08325 [Candidatus Nezhaarchaeales archaeon]